GVQLLHRAYTTRCLGRSARRMWNERRLPRRKIHSPVWVFPRRSRVLEAHREMPPPGNRLAWLVESGFPQDRVVAALVAVHDAPFRLECPPTPCGHACAIQLCGRSRVKATQWLGQPAIATSGPPGPGGGESDIAAPCTGPTSEVHDMHADPAPVLDALASGV